MRFASSLLLCGLMCHVLAAAGPEVTPVPAPDAGSWKEMPVAANELVVFGAAPAGSTWDFLDDSFRGRVFEGGKVAAFVFPEGRHKVIVTGPDGGRTRIVFVAGVGPAPPAPPTDSLVKELATLYAGEPAATRLKDMQSLSALYTLMVTEAANQSYATAAQLNARFVEARDLMLSDAKTPPRLPAIRKRCGAEVAAVIGDNPDAPLTEASRKAVAAVYAKLAQAVLDATK